MVSHARGEWKASTAPCKGSPTSTEIKQRGVGQLQRAAWNKLFPYLLFPQPAINTYYSSLSQGVTKQGKLGQRGLPKSYFPFKIFLYKGLMLIEYSW